MKWPGLGADTMSQLPPFDKQEEFRSLVGTRIPPVEEKTGKPNCRNHGHSRGEERGRTFHFLSVWPCVNFLTTDHAFQWTRQCRIAEPHPLCSVFCKSAMVSSVNVLKLGCYWVLFCSLLFFSAGEKSVLHVFYLCWLTALFELWICHYHVALFSLVVSSLLPVGIFVSLSGTHMIACRSHLDPTLLYTSLRTQTFPSIYIIEFSQHPLLLFRLLSSLP